MKPPLVELRLLVVLVTRLRWPEPLELEMITAVRLDAVEAIYLQVPVLNRDLHHDLPKDVENHCAALAVADLVSSKLSADYHAGASLFA